MNVELKHFRLARLGYVVWLFLAFNLASAQQQPARPSRPQNQPASGNGGNRAGLRSSAAAPQATTGDDYVIGTEDILAIDVWKEPEVSRTVPVRPDGRISLPLIGDLQASGHTPMELRSLIAEKLKAFITNPEVTVMVQEVKSRRFNVVGQVAKPGSYLLSEKVTVLDAIAMAGGFQQFAKSNRIYVLRRTNGQQVRIPFDYKAVIRGRRPEQNVELQPEDTVVVP